MRTALISAIAACAEERLQKKARGFLRGLSRDELLYIAEFLGACVIESPGRAGCSRGELADGIALFEQARRAPARRPGDREHKMILLLEYLRACNYSAASLSSRIQMLR